MQRHPSVEKRDRQNEKRNLRNTIQRSSMKTAIKKVRAAQNKETGAQELKNVAPLLDRLAAKRIIHKNKAANLKSKLTRFVNTLK
jgi:small subunit ribosomal protein S20